MSDEFDPSLLSGYLDGELTAEEASQVQQQLDQRADLREELESIRALRAAVAALPLSPVDEMLVRRVRSRIDQHRQRLANDPPSSSTFRTAPPETSTLKLTLSLMVAASILLAVGWTLWHTADLGGNVALQDLRKSDPPERTRELDRRAEPQSAPSQSAPSQSAPSQTLDQARQAADHPLAAPLAMEASEMNAPPPEAAGGEAADGLAPTGASAPNLRLQRRQMVEQDAPPDARPADSEAFSIQMRAQPRQAVPEAEPEAEPVSQPAPMSRSMQMRGSADSIDTSPPLPDRSMRAMAPMRMRQRGDQAEAMTPENNARSARPFSQPQNAQSQNAQSQNTQPPTPRMMKRSEPPAEVNGLQAQVLPRRALPWYQALPAAETELRAGRGAEPTEVAQRYVQSQSEQDKPAAAGADNNRTPPAGGLHAARTRSLRPSSQLVVRRVRPDQVPVVAQWWQQRLELPGEGAATPAWDPAEQALAVVGDAESIAKLRAEWQDFSTANRLSTRWQSLEEATPAARSTAFGAQPTPPSERPQVMAVEFQVAQ